VPNRTLDRRVEFIGLCGAGKSTFYALLKERIANAGILVAEQPPKPVPPLPAIAAGAGFAIAMALDARGLTFLAHAANWWLPMKLGYRVAQMRRAAPVGQWKVQVDSGLLQPIVSFAAEHNRRLDSVPVAAIVRQLDLPRVLIYLQAAAALALPRYIEREKLDAETAKHLEPQFVQAYNVCEAIVAECRKAGAAVITVDAGDSRSMPTAERVAEYLRVQIGDGHP
jgi:thymidylate kinase